MNTINEAQYVKNEEPESLPSLGAKEGARLGLVLSRFYVAINIVLIFLSNATTPGPPFIIRFVVGMVLALILGGCIGVLPAVFLGLITGWSIGKIVEHSHERLLTRQATLLGAITCGIMCLPIHLVFWLTFYYELPNPDSILTKNPLRPWVFLLGIPSIIYIVTGARLANNLYHARTQIQISKELHSS